MLYYLNVYEWELVGEIVLWITYRTLPAWQMITQLQDLRMQMHLLITYILNMGSRKDLLLLT